MYVDQCEFYKYKIHFRVLQYVRITTVKNMTLVHNKCVFWPKMGFNQPVPSICTGLIALDICRFLCVCACVCVCVCVCVYVHACMCPSNCVFFWLTITFCFTSQCYHLQVRH